MPSWWIPDISETCPGLQGCVRLGVGLGTYTFPAIDPVAGGRTSGFGQDLSNARHIVEGDGTWLMLEGVINTGGWRPQTYTFDLTPTVGLIIDGTFDPEVEGDVTPFLIDVLPVDMQGSGFSFTLAPGPGDFDHDGDVDLNDFATFAVCYHGAGVTVPPPGCGPADFEACDLEGDGDVELNDFASFALAYTG